MEVHKYDSIQIIVISCILACVCEGFNWLLLYRSESHRQLINKIGKAKEKLKLAHTSSCDNKKNAAKCGTLEDQVKKLELELQKGRITPQLIGVAIMISGVYCMSCLYDGRVILRLPFTPIFPFTTLTQRGLKHPGERDSSYAFVFTCSIVVVRTLISKFMGVTTGRDLFSTLLQDAQEKAKSLTD
eukprot:GHVR01166787.1.p1 GENE.GHVR01166787.1~~GHVR01166787.1.p1  ORF type:complete len:186 (+),score=30.33 GHVR01166787.1:49-606(+)